MEITFKGENGIVTISDVGCGYQSKQGIEVYFVLVKIINKNTGKIKNDFIKNNWLVDDFSVDAEGETNMSLICNTITTWDGVISICDNYDYYK